MAKSNKQGNDSDAKSEVEQSNAEVSQVETPVVEQVSTESEPSTAAADEIATLKAELAAKDAELEAAKIEAETATQLLEETARDRDDAVKEVESLREAASRSQDAALRETGMVLPGDPRVFSVNIPNGLVGRRYVVATSEAEAVEKYKGVTGTTTCAAVPEVSVMPWSIDQLPEGVELFGENDGPK